MTDIVIVSFVMTALIIFGVFVVHLLKGDNGGGLEVVVERRPKCHDPKEAKWFALLGLLRRELWEISTGKEVHGCNTVHFITTAMGLECPWSDEELQKCPVWDVCKWLEEQAALQPNPRAHALRRLRDEVETYKA